MSKIIAREVNPNHIDFSWYFDDDGLKSTSGENCACYIVPANRRRNYGFNMDEYKGIAERANCILTGFQDVENGYINSFEEVMQDNDIAYTSRKYILLKEWAKAADTNNADHVAEFLTITTGEEWSTRSFHGYSQGDYCEVVYCKAHYSEEHITEIGKLWLGCGTEFSIDDCYGYFVIDEIRWTEDERLANYLAECAGCKPEDLEIYLYKGEHTVSDYELMAV